MLLLSAGLTWSGGSSPDGTGPADGSEGQPGPDGAGPPAGAVDPGTVSDASPYADMERSDGLARMAARDVAREPGLELSYLAAILGARSLPPAFRTMPVVVATAGGATLLFAFMFVSRRRRDGEAPAADEMLATAAATGAPAVPAAPLVPLGGFGQGGAGWRPSGGSVPAGAPIDPEAHLPRWRRPSLMAARKADPLREQQEAAPMTFAAAPATASTAGVAAPGNERRRIRYRLVSLLDRPDELAGVPIGTLDQGDEVQLLERSGTYWLVLCPTGQQGWLHRMTLGEVIGDPVDDAAGSDWPTEASASEAAGLLALYASRLGSRDLNGAETGDVSDGAPSGPDRSEESVAYGNGHAAAGGYANTSGNGHSNGNGHGNGHGNGNGHAEALEPTPPEATADPDLVDEDVLVAFLAARGGRQWQRPTD